MKVQQGLLALAKAQRKTRNPWEAKLWQLLRDKGMQGFKFKRQQPIGPYIADFSCHRPKLIIELDGGQHNQPIKKESDTTRSQYFKKEGYKILRFWNNELSNNPDGVYQIIINTLNS